MSLNELLKEELKKQENDKKTIFALKTLARYDFSTVLTVQNCYKIKPALIQEMFNKIFKEHEIYNVDLQIIKSHPDFEDDNFSKVSQKTDCMHGRTLGVNGVYACPFLSNDYRGRVGSCFKNYSKTVMAETDFCATCSKNNNFIFTIG